MCLNNNEFLIRKCVLMWYIEEKKTDSYLCNIGFFGFEQIN